jgi:Tol biopolymer transport system component
VSVVEADSGKHVANLPVTLSEQAPDTIKVVYSVSCGTADPASDYQAKSAGTITFLKGQQTKYIAIAIKADSVPEAVVKQVIDNIRVVLGPAVVRTSAAQGDTTIVDNDGSASGLPQASQIQRINVSSNGDEAAAPPASICDTGGVAPPSGVWGEQISRNGRYVTFASAAGTLVDGDTNGIMDVFVRDLQTNATELVSLKPDGTQFTSSNPWGGGSSSPSISADGRYVTFYNGTDSSLYLRDRVAGTTQRISVRDVGGGGETSISDDGRYVTYAAYWSQVPGVTFPEDSTTDAVFLWDRDTNTNSLIAIRAPHNFDWTDANGVVTHTGWAQTKPVISGDGRYVAFADRSSGLVPGDTNNCGDVFVRDLQTGDTERVSVTNDGAEQQPSGAGQCSDGVGAISDDGRFVGFGSAAWNMYPGATNGSTVTGHAYIRDRLLGTTEVADAEGPGVSAALDAMSDDGRYVVYSCQCGDPVPIVPTANDFVSMWFDRQTGVTLEVGAQPDGTPPIDEDNGWFTSTIADGGVSGDGHTVAFTSFATNLVSDDTNGAQDAFVQRFG